jgi:hypothetical protein
MINIVETYTVCKSQKYNFRVQSHKRGHKTRLLQSSKPCRTKSLDKFLEEL